jgi:hypothetical protein
VHLWHVIDDTAALHALLRRCVATWGQLSALGDGAALALMGERNGALYRAKATAKALEAAARAWRIGRGRPVDRQALVDSGAVSDRFVDELADVAAQHGGDAKRLIAALEGGQVKRWHQSRTDKLRQYLCDAGHLDEQACIDADAIRMRVLAAVADDLAGGVIDDATVRRVLAALPG